MLLAFGSISVGLMLVTYALEERSHWFVLAFAAACASAATYGVLIEAWPFAAIEGIWSLVAVRRWWRRFGAERELVAARDGRLPDAAR